MKERAYPYTARTLRHRRRRGNAMVVIGYGLPLTIALAMFFLGLQNLDCRYGGEQRNPRTCAVTHTAIAWLNAHGIGTP